MASTPFIPIVTTNALTNLWKEAAAIRKKDALRPYMDKWIDTLMSTLQFHVIAAQLQHLCASGCSRRDLKIPLEVFTYARPVEGIYCTRNEWAVAKAQIEPSDILRLNPEDSGHSKLKVYTDTDFRHLLGERFGHQFRISQEGQVLREMEVEGVQVIVFRNTLYLEFWPDGLGFNEDYKRLNAVRKYNMLTHEGIVAYALEHLIQIY